MALLGPRLVIFLKRHELLVQSPTQNETLVYPKNLYAFGELTDSKAWKKLLEDNLSRFGKPQKYLIVLDECFVYQKTYLSQGKNENQKENFLSDLPIAPSDTTILDLKSKKILIAGYTKPASILAAVLEQSGFKLDHIVPYSVIFGSQVPTDPKLFSQVLKKSSQFKSLDLNQTKTQGKQKDKSEILTPNKDIKDSKNNTLKYLILTGVLTSAFFTLVTFIQNQKNLQNQTGTMTSAVQPSPTPTTTPIPTTTPTPVEIDKKDISIIIENGTGTPGEAKKVSTVLTAAGYSKIKAQNSKTPNDAVTLVSFTQNVTQTHRTTIIESLKTIFTQVSQASASAGQKTEVYILTGSD